MTAHKRGITAYHQKVEKAISKIKIGKVTFIDEIEPEYVKYGGTKVKHYTRQNCNKAWVDGTVSKDWEKSLIIAIHKKGRTTDCGNYRAICLSSVVLKIYSSILEKNIREEVEEKLEEEQSAFRKDR